jgi:pimeloyl-ACP methyl ester carboxylesterase
METFYLQNGDFKTYIANIKSINDKTNTVLIFLHDSWGCVEMWGDFPYKMVKLSGLNALLYDRRGYGQSSCVEVMHRTEFYLHDEADELIKVMDLCNIQNAILYGHSDGATIALIAAAKYPQRINGLILEGPHSFIEESGKAAVLATREKVKETKLLTSLQKFHGNKTTELFRLWHETWLGEDFKQWSIVPLLSLIQCPVLAFQGENDMFGSIEQLNILKQTIPSSVTISEIADAEHTPRKESEKYTIDLINKWIAENNFIFTK